MLEFLAKLFAGIFAPVPVANRSKPQQGGYYEGDDSNWIVTDNGPMQFGNPTGE